MGNGSKDGSKDTDLVDTSTLRFTSGVTFADVDTRGTPGFGGSREEGESLQAKLSENLGVLQEMLYANGRSGDNRAVLLVLQGMDTSGKGGIVKHVVGQVDPQGVDHTSFGKPTKEELKHHYLWRIRRALPTGGQLGVFDRSHYEDVLVVRVHNLVPPEVWSTRYDEINAFEKELTDSGTTLLKVALAVSLDEQKARLTERLDRPDKYWKFDPSDIDERAFWADYMDAYQAVFEQTHTEYAPWHIVPCDRKWYSRLAVTALLDETLSSLDLSWPDAKFDVEEQKRRLASA